MSDPPSRQAADSISEPAPPTPAMVEAARGHLTARYAATVDKMFWQLDKIPLPDLQAINSVVAFGGTDGRDLAAALILVRAARLDLDRLEADLLDSAYQAGLSWQNIAALLDLSGPDSAQRRYREIQARRRYPVHEVPASSRRVQR